MLSYAPLEIRYPSDLKIRTPSRTPSKKETQVNNNQIQIRAIEDKIFLLRGHKIMLDSHLSVLYGVEVKMLVRSVKRNIGRFPADFMFQLTKHEAESLRCQIGTSKDGRGGRRYLPYAFTENGVSMLSSVLRSKTAIQVNIEIMRTFTKLREWLTTHRDLQEKIRRIEEKYDGKFVEVFKKIDLLTNAPERQIDVKGFGQHEK